MLVATALAIAASMLGLYSGPVVASIPAGFPPFTVDDIPWDRRPDLVLPGIVIALIGFSESASISRRFASEDRVHWNANRELISQGVANVAAAATGGMPCGGSFSRSARNRLSGAVTRLSGGITGLVVLIVLPFASIFESLPYAVLGAIVIVAVLGLIQLGPLVRLWRVSIPQAGTALGTFLATLLLSPRLDTAVLIGVGLSIAVLLWRLLQLEIDVHFDDPVLTFTLRGVLWFGTAQRLDATLLDSLAAHPDAQRLIVDLARLGRIDTTGALVLRSVLDQARVAGLAAQVRGTPPQSQALADRVLNPEKARSANPGPRCAHHLEPSRSCQCPHEDHHCGQSAPTPITASPSPTNGRFWRGCAPGWPCWRARSRWPAWCTTSARDRSGLRSRCCS